MNEMNIHEVLKYLPHRYPFLLIDRVIDFEKGKSITAIKNVTINEPIFTGHFPDYPIFPGVLIIEAMAQASAILGFQTGGGVPLDDALYLFVGIDKARFKRQVTPGDQIVFTVEVVNNKRGIWKFKAVAKVDDIIVCVADIMCAIREKTL